MSNPLSFTSSAPLRGPVTFDVAYPDRPSQMGDGPLLTIIPTSSTVATEGTVVRASSDPNGWVFTPSSSLAANTVYLSMAPDPQSWWSSNPPRLIEIGRWSTEARPMVAGLWWVSESPQREIHLNIRFSEPVDPMTVAANVTLTIDEMVHPLSIVPKDATHFTAEITDAASIPEAGGGTVRVRFGAAIATLDGRTLEPTAFALPTAQLDGSCLLELGGLSTQRGIGYCFRGVSCDPADSN